jgi:zinc protease
MRWTATVARTVLPNGLTLLVQRDSSAPVVAVVTYVSAGYFDEPDEWAGISHLLEHMFFKGTAARGPGALARETQRLGGYLNAATSYDRTVYYAVVPSAGEGLARALELQADALRHAALDAGEFERERDVVIQEAKRKLDDPAAVTQETLYQLLFRVHRMRRWRIGTESGLRAIGRDDLREYYQTRYVPGRVIVSLAGDLDPDRALELAGRTYGDWRRPAVPIPGSPPEPPERAASLRVLQAEAERPLVALGWRTVDAVHPDAPALDLAADVLGLGRASWLSREVRLPGLAAAAGSSHFTAGDVGVLDVFLASDAGKVGAALERSVALAERLADPGPDEGQVERVKALAASHWARRFESADGRATTLAYFEALGGYALADRYLDDLEAVDAGRIRDVAGRYLPAGAACAVVCLPHGARTSLSEDRWPVTEPGLTAPPATRLTVAGGAPPPHRARRPAAGDFARVAWPGADALARRRPGSGLVTVACFLADVTGAETPATAGLSRLMVRAALRGAGDYDGAALAAAAERLGGSVAISGDADLLGWSLTVPAPAAADAARLLRLIAGVPRLSDDGVAVERALLADDAARLRDDMYRFPIQQVLSRAFAGDVYGLPPLGEPEVVRSFEGRAVREWHERALARRALLVVVGDLETEGLLRAADAFSDWSGAPAREPAVSPAWRAATGGETRSKAQTALAMAFPAPPASADRRFALVVAGALLSGLAGRLFEELRERRALAYTVQALPWLRRRAGAVIGYVATSPEREDEARQAMLAELARLADVPPDPEETERARQYAAGLVALGRQHGSAVAAELADAWVHDTLADFEREEDRRRAVTADEIHAVARDVFQPALRAEYAVRGAPASR